MAGIKDLRKLQFGWETTAGTAVAATKIYRGLGVADDRREIKSASENVGYIADIDRVYTTHYLSAIDAPATEATFEQLIFWGATGIKTLTPASDGVGSGKIWDFAAHYGSSLNTIKTATIEAGDNQQAEEIEYCFAEGFKIEGKVKEALMVSGTWLGRQSTLTSFTGALSLSDVEAILFQKGKIYIDAIGGTMGSTQKSSTFLGLALDVKTGIMPVFTGDGNMYFTFHKFTKPVINCEITFEHDGTATAEIAAWRALTGRLIRLEFVGSALTTPGTNYSYKTLRLDLCGKWLKFDKLDEVDGNDIVKGTLQCFYNSTAAKFFNMTVVNEVASL